MVKSETQENLIALASNHKGKASFPKTWLYA
jgi:hypothetical protein